MIDAHNHLQQFADPDRIIAEMKAAGIDGCIVNGTSEEDWTQVAALADRHPDFVHPAFGLHPWFAHRRSDAWLAKLEDLLDQYPTASIGECGLDRWIEEPSLEIQRAAFLPQLRLARERSLPLTLHALKAWGPLFDALATEPPPDRGFMLHSYGGSPELVAQFLPLGARFSFSGYFLHPKKSATLEAYREVPSDRLFIETDAPEMTPPEPHLSHPLPDQRNHPANLPTISDALADFLNLSPDTLAARCNRNTRRFFKLL